tara:strand:- start:163 stop:453 length:291 start_codon:yes stop_codon:yes gene_type:complete
VKEGAIGADDLEERFGSANPAPNPTKPKAKDETPSASSIFNDELQHWKDEFKSSPLGQIKMPEIKMPEIKMPEIKIVNPFKKKESAEPAPTSSGQK